MLRLSYYLLPIIMTLAAQGQTFTTLANFNGTNGAAPVGSLVEDANGKLYGTTYSGGSANDGTIFSVTTARRLSSLFSFTGANGANPDAGLYAAANGSFYGTTLHGGTHSSAGTVYRFQLNGTLTTLVNFDTNDGAESDAQLIQLSNGALYGTTSTGAGGVSGGTVFVVTPSGALTTLHRFSNSAGALGLFPEAGLLPAGTGELYGTTSSGGLTNNGTVYRISPAGAFNSLFSFDYTNGSSPLAPLIEGTDNNLYGTTQFGGTSDSGTVFQITLGGVETVLHNFSGTDGSQPHGALVEGSDGNFYGTTAYGGASNLGTIFQISATGTLVTLHSFSGADGAYPSGALIQGTDGAFYGTTSAGGGHNLGTVFRLAIGLAALPGATRANR